MEAAKAPGGSFKLVTAADAGDVNRVQTAVDNRPATLKSTLSQLTSSATQQSPSLIVRRSALRPRIDVVDTWGFDQRPPVSTVCSYFTHLRYDKDK